MTVLLLLILRNDECPTELTLFGALPLPSPSPYDASVPAFPVPGSTTAPLPHLPTQTRKYDTTSCAAA